MTNEAALSCPPITFKAINERVRNCAKCGLGPLHRDLFSAFLAQLILSNGLAPQDVDLSEGLLNTRRNRAKAQRLCGVSSTGHKGPATTGTSRPATLTDTETVSGNAAKQAACRESVSDLAVTSLTGPAARRRSRPRGSEGTRPPDDRTTRRGSRTTASGGGTTPSSGPAPPALVH